MRAAGLVCLGAGAGLIRGDLREVRGTDVACRSGGVLVSVRGARPRAVPVLARYHARLLAAAAFAGTSLVCDGTDPGRRNLTNPRGRGHWLLVRRSLSDPAEIAYYACYGPRRSSTADLAWIAASSWHIEQCFQQAKNEAGLDHYQVRSWRAWYAHITCPCSPWPGSRLARRRPRKRTRHRRAGPDRLHLARDPQAAGLPGPRLRTRSGLRVVLVLAPATPVPGPAASLPAPRLRADLGGPDGQTALAGHPVVMLIHLDTDLGGDTDDACALAFLLGQPEAELAGVTTVADRAGRRAGYARYCLGLAGRDGIPVAAGAGLSMTTLQSAYPVTGDERYWPDGLPCSPSSPGAALDLLLRNIERGATVVAIGPWTNLALLEITRPGSLGQAPVVASGGWTGLGAGLPPWGPEMDFNVQQDTLAAEIVAAAADLTLAPLPVTLTAHLRAAELPRLRASGPLGELLAGQGEAHGHDFQMAAMGRRHAGLPDDLLNFHYDPVACAVALGWPGAAIDQTRLQLIHDGALVRFEPADAGRPMRMLTDLDPASFTEYWLNAVETAQSSA